MGIWRAFQWWLQKDAIKDRLTRGFEPGSFLYIPWIQSQGDRLIELIEARGEKLAALQLHNGLKKRTQRKKMTRSIRSHPVRYTQLLLDILEPIADDVAGLIFTLDWTPAMRQAVHVCRHLGIPTVLIPHESVFVDKQLFYRDSANGVDYPLCDRVLAWGQIQKDIFIERGFSEDHIEIVGSPKLDAYYDYSPTYSHEEFCSRYGLEPCKRTILFAMQPLDSQLNERLARRQQNLAIGDVLAFAEETGCQVIVRHPPSGHNLLSRNLKQQLASKASFNVDSSGEYKTTPEESIYHSDVVVSINSTMLFEAAMMNRPSISAKYVEFEGFWDNVGIPFATEREGLRRLLTDALENRRRNTTDEGMQWAARAFSVGKFDGGATSRIWARLKEVREERAMQNDRLAIYDHLFCDYVSTRNYGTCGFHTTIKELNRYVPQMLGFRRLITPRDTREASICDVFAKWGITPTKAKQKQDAYVHELRRPQLIVEDGFIRSVDIGLSGTPGLSIIVDDKTAYYDATRSSRLEDRLASGHTISEEQQKRARACIEKIQTHRISKYNHAPDISEEIGSRSHKVLLVDQRFGDQSVVCGNADEMAFVKMFDDVLERFPDSDIVIKRHPDATKGGKHSYYNDRTVADARRRENVHLIDYEINPHSLFDQVDEVFVVTSGMGFEALLAGKKVHCYGMPFYAGWGATEDTLSLERRGKHRTALEIFYYAFIESSRYYNPAAGAVGEIEGVINYIAEAKKNS